MPSISAISMMIGAGAGIGAGGVYGWKKATREGYDTEDRLAFAGSSAMAGGGAALALNAIGIRHIIGVGSAGLTGMNVARKGLMWNPIKTALKAGGRTKFGISAIPKGLRGPLAGLALMAGGIGAVAYGARSNPQPNMYSSNDEYGNVQYNQQSVKERMGLLGAAGEMVFGMHNMRHG
jgi:hypothetical protein